jgi:predicted nuclease of predicted toxin-antitoxin system
MSRRILPFPADLFPDSTHTTLVGLSGETPDRSIWEFAKEQGSTIATADSDFLRLGEVYGPPPKIIRLEKMNYSTELAASLIRRYAVAIKEFERSAKALLILRRT